MKHSVFLNDRGHPLTANGIEWLLHRYGTQVELAVTPHQLRHTFARQLTEAGMPLPSLSKLMGHAQRRKDAKPKQGSFALLAALREPKL